MFAHQPLGNFCQSTAGVFKGVSAHQNKTPSLLRHSKTYNLNHIAQRILPPNPQPPLPLILLPPSLPPSLLGRQVGALSEAATREGRLRRFFHVHCARSSGRRGTLSEPCRRLVSLNSGPE